MTHSPFGLLPVDAILASSLLGATPREEGRGEFLRDAVASPLRQGYGILAVKIERR